MNTRHSAAAPAQATVLGCECCGLAMAAPSGDAAPRWRCPHCGHPLHARKPMALQRTWAWLAASALLYVPANLLPIMSTTNLLGRTRYTIAGGIGDLWNDGEWGLAIIVFVASIAVPILKISGLALLAWTARHAPRWRRPERARLFRVVDAVGHWSMLDVYVVVLLSGMVHFGSLASVQPEPGLIAFAAVVMLTVFAARSFDPRLIWQEPLDHG